MSGAQEFSYLRRTDLHANFHANTPSFSYWPAMAGGFVEITFRRLPNFFGNRGNGKMFDFLNSKWKFPVAPLLGGLRLCL